MTTTQIKPISGGAFQNVNRDSRGCATKSQSPGVTLAPHNTNLMCSYINEWTNAGGVGTHATLAAQKLAALGVTIAEN
jgi:hypothetical protein